jgi:ABC-type transport system involved in multi-copper enzyme maturation permease subunit
MNGEPSAAATAHNLQDFPDWLPAMLVKELRQGMRAPLFLQPFAGVHAVAIITVAREYFSGGPRDLVSPFWGLAFLVVAVIMPLRGFAALREECDGGNTSLLILGGLSRWQIVRGKWLVQIVLSGLTFVSLLPYLLVRYFLGGFEIIPNALVALNVMTASAGVSGCIIGASGYRSVSMRFVAAGIGIFWVMAASIAAFVGASSMGKLFSGGDWWVFWMIYGCALGWQFLYAVTGLQLGRAHLKLYLRPWEVPPTRAVVSLLFFLPFILLAGAIGLMFWGFPIVLGFVIFAVCRYDRQLTPTPVALSRPASNQATGPSVY